MTSNIWTGMTPTAKRHMRAICGDAVTKSNIIGLRKAFNAQARKNQGLSASRTAPNVTTEEIEQLKRALADKQPRVIGELHDSGAKLLRSAVKRYRSRYTEAQREIMASVAYFRLIGFDWLDSLHCVPVYRVFSAAGPLRDGYGDKEPRPQFAFRNVPWQSAMYMPDVMSGPEILI